MDDMELHCKFSCYQDACTCVKINEVSFIPFHLLWKPIEDEPFRILKSTYVCIFQLFYILFKTKHKSFATRKNYQKN